MKKLSLLAICCSLSFSAFAGLDAYYTRSGIDASLEDHIPAKLHLTKLTANKHWYGNGEQPDGFNREVKVAGSAGDSSLASDPSHQEIGNNLTINFMETFLPWSLHYLVNGRSCTHSPTITLRGDVNIQDCINNKYKCAPKTITANLYCFDQNHDPHDPGYGDSELIYDHDVVTFTRNCQEVGEWGTAAQCCSGEARLKLDTEDCKREKDCWVCK